MADVAELQALGHVFFNVLGPIALLVVIGYGLQQRLQLDTRSLSRVVFFVLTPSLIFTSILSLEIDVGTIGRTLLFAAADMAIMGLLAAWLARRWGYDTRLAGVFVVTAILLNNGNYGLPLNLFAFGETGFGYALVLFMFNNLVGNTLSIFILAHGQNGLRQALWRTFTAPMLWAMLLGFGARLAGMQPTGSFFTMLQMTGRSAIPVFLLILGMTLTQTRARLGNNPITRLTVLRMLGGPALALLLARGVGLTGLPFAVAVLQASMPTAVNTIVLSNEFEASPHFVAGAVLFTTLASLITLPVLLLFLSP